MTLSALSLARARVGAVSAQSPDRLLTCGFDLHVVSRGLMRRAGSLPGAKDAGRLIRPAQDCSVRYGRAITLNRVDVLTKTNYVEVPVGRITAGWAVGNVAAHGFDYTDAIEVIDGRRPVRGAEDRRRARHVSDFKTA